MPVVPYFEHASTLAFPIPDAAPVISIGLGFKRINLILYLKIIKYCYL
ncbi:hypothetical protein P256_02357 [Acinetobacter nectaris CIP 110549]|uniref:Uncharacterized protein n=1 Tax=Acinetobacter nectaris CIP 110549 TaxID=1392540 RepID=V2TIK7_9GAMM|nr:hypothetical protein P256_02357 [Acinetobacter nectaris CIP 110549]